MDPRFTHPRYLLRKKFLKLLGGEFRISDPSGQIAFFARQKVKLKEDIRLYTDDSMSTEVLTIHARKAIDFSAAYDVLDPAAGETVGALRRKGLRSMLRDEWVILDAAENEIGAVQEESMFSAILRRTVLGALLPQTFLVTVGGQQVARFHQRFNPFVKQIDLDFTPDTGSLLDRRLGIAAAVLLSAIEGRQA
ncbi:MAG TPA: hypothetical protein VM840_11650 [Actinomycetota bacterium]|nr:hypothetical protein [Actinomycetota bacterium]